MGTDSWRQSARSGQGRLRFAAPARFGQPVFERLAKNFERPATEFRHLVEKQHPVVRQADLAGARDRAAAGERDVRHRVVRRAKRPCAQQPRPRREQPGNGVNGGDVERLVERQRRQNARRRASPSSSCPIRAGRRAARCAHPPRQSRARAGPAVWPRTSAKSRRTISRDGQRDGHRDDEGSAADR